MATGKKPELSVVVPTYNRAEKLKETLNSLLRQSIPCEIIIVDDGSRDDTPLIAKNFGFKYIKCEHRGPAASRNIGIKNANADIVAFIDDDCIAPERWAETLLEGYKRHPHVAGAGGYMLPPQDAKGIFADYERHNTKKYGAFSGESVYKEDGPVGSTCNMSYRKSVLLEAGGFDERFVSAAGEDIDLRDRVYELGYSLLFIPVAVIHNADYSFRGFLRRSLMRADGVFVYEQKRGRRFSIKTNTFNALSAFLRFLLFLILIDSISALESLELFIVNAGIIRRCLSDRLSFCTP
ncbi:MAG: glycosyltransferase [Candidatus Micrarchaeia archaeon]